MDRRSQTRITDSELVMLSWKEGAVLLKQLGNVDDMSLDGLGIRVDHAIPVGTPVSVSYGDEALEGTVRRCARILEDHFIGVEFVAGSKDSEVHFSPELMIRSCID